MMKRSKQEYHIWVSEDIGTELQRRATDQKRPISHIIEEMIKTAMQSEAAQHMDKHAVPRIREAISEDQTTALEELRKQIRTDLNDITTKQTDRLATLQVRAARSTSLAWRLTYRLALKQYGAAIAQQWYDEERVKAGKAMASHTNSGKEIEQ